MKITGAIKALDVPEDFCLTNIPNLIRDLENLLAVEFDVENITNVSVSSSAPDTTDRDVVWFKTDNSGNLTGINLFIQGQWRQMFPPPSGIVKAYGDSNSPDDGYVLVTSALPGFTDAMVAKLQESWLLHPTEVGRYVIFDVVYVGL
jgi:hypothetical protein